MRGAPLETQENAEIGRDRDLDLTDAYELGRKSERERCAEIAEVYARALSKGTHPRAGSVEEIGQRIADEIRKPL